jgi:hypothetical protein
MHVVLFDLFNQSSASVSVRENLPVVRDCSLLVRALLLWSFILVIILRLR